THRHSHETPKPLVPGQEIEVDVALDHIAYRLPAGHRLRIAVSSNYWPMIWPAPEAATLTLTGGSLDLPVRLNIASADEANFAPAVTAKPLALQEIRPEAHLRRTEIDQQTGIVSLIIEDDFGEYQNPDHGGIAGSIARERWDIHPDDPLSARGQAHWTEVVERDGRRLRTETYCSMTSDRQTFHLSARLEAYEGEDLIYHRDYDDDVPRDYI
ncbi:MAG: CocE/NonD family hydrolase C-terminal non-catalytic domain-containing protein, partial [Albidovulum sp.]